MDVQGHDAIEIAGRSGIERAAKERAGEGGDGFRGGLRMGREAANGVGLFGDFEGALEGGDEEFLLRAEVVADGGDIGASVLANFGHGGVAEGLLGEDDDGAGDEIFEGGAGHVRADATGFQEIKWVFEKGTKKADRGIRFRRGSWGDLDDFAFVEEALELGLGGFGAVGGVADIAHFRVAGFVAEVAADGAGGGFLGVGGAEEIADA